MWLPLIQNTTFIVLISMLALKYLTNWLF